MANSPSGTVNPMLLSVPQAAKTLAISPRLLYRLMARGQIKTISLGKARRVPVAEIEAFIARQMEQAAS